MSLGQPHSVYAISTPPTPALRITTNLPNPTRFTAMCWAMHTGGNDATYSDLIAISDDNDAIGIGSHFTGSVRVFSLGDLLVDLETGTVFPDNEWHHCAFTMNDGGRAIGYFDGVEAMRGALTYPVTPTFFSAFNSRSSNSDPGGCWIGNLSGLKVWNDVALSPAEIRREMWTLMPRRRNNIWALSPLIGLNFAGQNYAGLAGTDWTVQGVSYFADGTSEPAGVVWDMWDGVTTVTPVTTIQGRPIQDITAGNWVPTPSGALYTTLDEAVTDDADFILSTGAQAYGEVLIEQLASPGAGTATIVIRSKQ